MTSRTITLAAALLAIAPLAVSLSLAQEKALEQAQQQPQDQAAPQPQEQMQAQMQAQTPAPAPAQPMPAQAQERTRAPAQAQVQAQAAAPAEVPAQDQPQEITRAEVKQAFQEARQFGMLAANGEIADPEPVLAAREAYNERQTVAIARLTAERNAQWAAYHEAVARHAAWQREQELLATQQRSSDDAAVASRPLDETRP